MLALSPPSALEINETPSRNNSNAVCQGILHLHCEFRHEDTLGWEISLLWTTIVIRSLVRLFLRPSRFKNTREPLVATRNILLRMQRPHLQVQLKSM